VRRVTGYKRRLLTKRSCISTTLECLTVVPNAVTPLAVCRLATFLTGNFTAPFKLKHRKTTLTHYGGWLPSSSAAYDSFFSQLTSHVSSRRSRASTHTPAVAAFARAINDPSDPEPKMIDLFNQIFLQAASPNNTVVSSSSVPITPHLLLLDH
jgi:hypothetical protein